VVAAFNLTAIVSGHKNVEAIESISNVGHHSTMRTKKMMQHSSKK
jgi:hypothetical protein